MQITKMEKEIPTPDSKHLDGKRTIAHTRLANKYMQCIQKIIDGNQNQLCKKKCVPNITRIDILNPSKFVRTILENTGDIAAL